MSLFYVCVFCDSFLCSISLLLLSAFLSCILNSVLYTYMYVIVHVSVLFGTQALVCAATHNETLIYFLSTCTDVRRSCDIFKVDITGTSP